MSQRSPDRTSSARRPQGLRRRALLRLLGTFGLCFAAPVTALASGARATTSAELVGRLGAPQGAGRLAKRIRAQHGAVHVAAISKRLDRRLRSAADRNLTSTAVLRRTVQAWIAADFAGDRVVSVDGWRLSETEVGLALLTADTQSGLAARSGPGFHA